MRTNNGSSRLPFSSCLLSVSPPPFLPGLSGPVTPPAPRLRQIKTCIQPSITPPQPRTVRGHKEAETVTLILSANSLVLTIKGRIGGFVLRGLICGYLVERGVRQVGDHRTMKTYSFSPPPVMKDQMLSFSGRGFNTLPSLLPP